MANPSMKAASKFIKQMPAPHFRCIAHLELECIRNRSNTVDYSHLVPTITGTIMPMMRIRTGAAGAGAISVAAVAFMAAFYPS